MAVIPGLIPFWKLMRNSRVTVFGCPIMLGMLSLASALDYILGISSKQGASKAIHQVGNCNWYSLVTHRQKIHPLRALESP